MRDDRHRLQQVLSTGERLLEVVERRGIDRETIERDDEVQWMLTTPLYHIGEQVYNLSEELTDRYREVPWSAIAGLRHRLVHDYDYGNPRVSATRGANPQVRRVTAPRRLR